MFDFEKLEEYLKSKTFNLLVSNFLKQSKLNNSEKDQLRRAALSILLNIAEGTGRYTKPDKRNFYVIARGSVFECVAIFDFFQDQGEIEERHFKEIYILAEEISKMLFSLIKNLET